MADVFSVEEMSVEETSTESGLRKSSSNIESGRSVNLP